MLNYVKDVLAIILPQEEKETELAFIEKLLCAGNFIFYTASFKSY